MGRTAIEEAQREMVESFARAAHQAGVEAAEQLRRLLCESLTEFSRMVVPAMELVEAATRFAEQTRAMLAEWYESLPEEEREEMRRLAEDAPLCEVDVNAPERLM